VYNRISLLKIFHGLAKKKKRNVEIFKKRKKIGYKTIGGAKDEQFAFIEQRQGGPLAI
jgi:hypothetical protein